MSESLSDNKPVEQNLDLCRQIQRAMIPHSLPVIHGIDLKSIYQPCGALGGDLFDVIQVSEDVLAFFIFDVACHGVPSALISAIAKVSFSNHMRLVTSPAAVLERVNSEIREHLSADFYLTAFVAYLDLHNNKLTYCGAGHPHPVVVRKKDTTLQSLSAAGGLIGVFDDTLFEDESVFLYAGDWFLLFTDGLYGLFTEENEVLGRKNLEEFLLKSGGEAASDVVAQLQERCTGQFDSGVLKDDVTVVSVEIQTQSRKEQIKEKLGYRRDDPVYLQYISYYEEMDRAAGAVLRDMDAAAYPDDDIRRMKITLTELFANAIGHGNGEDHSRKVTIGHMVNRTVATVAIMDEGEGFDPRAIPDPTLPENLVKDHGRGLYIVGNYVDNIEYNETGNRVLIQKNHEHS